ncbi:type IV pilin N-terminal domain-containing protein [Methanoregula sp.]|uniref:type IV pilin N-terminal domain-containing protein n=1 Tax=Methanoregula sp. TaxID=2052170 RepID=UPI0026300F19|nr:type IV pilin N-terminal domain-containing protein [Methanoregula sp.]MDD5144346.1 type IV pilin N-terminal domain-containing protein [Methanoregula sp.]
MKGMTSDAVSPVVGVMLMLVVTIIIAAVVSSFAGGMAGDAKKAPQATLVVSPVIQSLEGTPAANGILVVHNGGDAFSLDNIEFMIEDFNGATRTFTTSDKLPALNRLPAGISNNGYFRKIGNTSPTDCMIAPGDKFMFYADNYTYSSWFGGYELLWQPNDVANKVYGYFNKVTAWAIIDKRSGDTIAKGELVFK